MHKLTKTVHRYKGWYARHREAVHNALLGALALIVAIITGQMFYPYGRMLPGISIDNREVGGKSVQTVARELEKRYDPATLTIKTVKRTYTVPMKNIGIEVVAEPTADMAAEYKLRERLVPFSFLTKLRTNIQPILRYDDQRLAEFAAEISQENGTLPINAAITVENEKATLVPAKMGLTYRVGDIMRDFHELAPSTKAMLTLKPVEEPPKLTNEAVAPTLTTAQKIIDAPLVLAIEKEKVTIDKKTVASWIDFKEGDNGRSLQLIAKPDAVKAYLTDLRTRINRDPAAAQVTLVDGRTVSRTEGVAGFGVDVDKSADLITQQLLGAAGTALSLPLISLPPVAVYNRSYTDTQAGLNALMGDVAAEKKLNMAVVELGGQGRRADVGGDRPWHAASTYKLFVAYAVLTQIASGDMHWGDSISYGKNAAGCFESMIVQSDNVCASAFGDKIGWQVIETMMHSMGLRSTYLSSKTTTANDLALFLTKLETGSLLSGSSRDKLLDAMRRQIYRDGIPRGTGVAAANKVGYIWGVRHDAGIVYAPGGTYIVVFMTPGLSWPSIADAARQMHAFLK